MFLLAEDEALKGYLQGMTVADEADPERPVRVWFGYPDIELRAQQFPFITIDVIDIRQAFERQTSGFVYDEDFQGTTPAQGGLYYKYDVPIAYDIEYQVTSYSRHPRHDRQIVFQMTHKFPGKWGYLPVPNELGTHTAYRHMFLESFVKRDTVEPDLGNKRLFRNVFTIRVVSELTPRAAIEYINQVESVSINTNNLTGDDAWEASHVPPSLQLP